VRRVLLTLALCAALGVAGCGGDDDSSSEQPASTATATQEPASGGGGGETIKIAADPSGALKFQQTELTAKAGKATIDFDNPASVAHAVEIEGVEGSETDTVTGEKTSVTVDLKPGKYEFFCPVPGHKEAGMVGTLTVE
jgi:plastocyanin